MKEENDAPKLEDRLTPKERHNVELRMAREVVKLVPPDRVVSECGFYGIPANIAREAMRRRGLRTTTEQVIDALVASPVDTDDAKIAELAKVPVERVQRLRKNRATSIARAKERLAQKKANRARITKIYERVQQLPHDRLPARPAVRQTERERKEQGRVAEIAAVLASEGIHATEGEIIGAIWVAQLRDSEPPKKEDRGT